MAALSGILPADRRVVTTDNSFARVSEMVVAARTRDGHPAFHLPASGRGETGAFRRHAGGVTSGSLVQLLGQELAKPGPLRIVQVAQHAQAIGGDVRHVV